MGKLFSTVVGWFTGGASGLMLYAIVAAASAGAAGLAVHTLDHGAYEDLVDANDKAQTKAVTEAKQKQADADKLVIDSAVSEAGKQQAIAVQTAANLAKVKDHVKELTASCITVGLVRVFDAGIYGVDPANLSLAPGESDDACAGITAASLAESVYANYGLARQNAEQLNALEAYVAKAVAQAQ